MTSYSANTAEVWGKVSGITRSFLTAHRQFPLQPRRWINLWDVSSAE